MLSVASIIKKHSKQGKDNNTININDNNNNNNNNNNGSNTSNNNVPSTKNKVTHLYTVQRHDNADSDDDSDELPLLLQNSGDDENGPTNDTAKKKNYNNHKKPSPNRKVSGRKNNTLQPRDLNATANNNGNHDNDKRSSPSNEYGKFLNNEDADSSIMSSLDSSTLNGGTSGGESGGFTDSGGFPSVAVVMPKTYSGPSFNHDPYFQFNSGSGASGEDGGGGADGGENNANGVKSGGGKEDIGGGGGSGNNTKDNNGSSSKSPGSKLAAIQQLTANLNGITLDTLWESESLADSETEMSTTAQSYASSNIVKQRCREFELVSNNTGNTDDSDENENEEDFDAYCVPGDIAAPLNTVPISPLTVGGRKSMFIDDMEPFPCSPINILSPDSNDDDGSRGSSDSAIDLLHTVNEDGIQDFTVAGDEPFFQSTMSTSTIPIHPSCATPTLSAPAPPSSPSSPTSYNATVLLQRYEVNCNADALYLSHKEVVLAAHDKMTGLSVTLKLMSDVKEFKSELEGRRNLDPAFILPVVRAMVDWDMVGTVMIGGDSNDDGPIVGGIEVEKIRGAQEELGGFVKALVRNTSDAGVELDNDEHDITTNKLDEDDDTHNGSQQPLHHHESQQKQYLYPYLLCLEAYNATLADTLSRRSDCNIALARKITRDVVVALILLHTENKVHANLSTHSIVRVGNQWKIKDLSMCSTVGTYIDMKRCKIAYSPPEVATPVLEMNGRLDDEGLLCIGKTEYDLWSLGTVLYSLFLGTSLWNSDSHGYVSSDDLNNLARWSPQSFLRMAYLYFPPDGRSDDERAAIDLISKLLMPTAADRKSNFEFGIVSVHQHEFLEDLPLEAESLVAFGERQAVMLRSETEQNRFNVLTKSLSLEERWELNRSRDVLLTGLFETTDVHTPTSFVVLTEKLEPVGSSCTFESSSGDDVSMYGRRRLEEALRWIQLFEELGPSVRGSLDGDLTSVGHFWAKIKKTFHITTDYVYLYFIDDMTGEIVIPEQQLRNENSSSSSKSRYPLEIKVRSDLFPKLVPLMQVTMRSMALYHGVAGIARMFGCPQPNLTRAMRMGAQERTDALKNESSASPFGTTLADDVAKLRNNKEQFLKNNKSLRCMSIHVLIRFLDKKVGCDFSGLKRLVDEDGRAIWTTIDDAMSMKQAIQNRAQERLCEERNLWDDSQDWQIRKLQGLLNVQARRGVTLTNSLGKVEEVKNVMEEDARRYREENGRLEDILSEMGKKLEDTEAALEKERRKMKLLWIKRGGNNKKKKSLDLKPSDSSLHSFDEL